MTDPEQISDLIGNIYDAALDPALWVGVLNRVSEFAGGCATALYWKDATRKNGNVYYEDGGIDLQYKQLYFERYMKLDPATTGHYFAEIGQPVATNDLMPYSEFLETRFYKEWVHPQGLVDNLTALLDKAQSNAALISVFRHERNGLVDDEMRQRMRLIIPHMRRAALIGRVIDLKAAEAASLVDTLDGLTAGMFLVDDTARIVHANASGHAMLAANDFLCASGGRLVAADGQIDRALREMLAAAGGGDAALGIKGIAVPLSARDGECYVAHLLPLTSGARRRAGTNYTAVAALFVHKAALDAPSPPELIARMFGLTPSELRVLLCLVEVGGVPETAVALGVAETTVKTHLHHLFAKTGTSRQAELVKLVAGFSNPLCG